MLRKLEELNQAALGEFLLVKEGCLKEVLMLLSDSIIKGDLEGFQLKKEDAMKRTSFGLDFTTIIRFFSDGISLAANYVFFVEWLSVSVRDS